MTEKLPILAPDHQLYTDAVDAMNRYIRLKLRLDPVMKSIGYAK